MEPLPILLTRPAAQARRLAAELAGRGAGRIVVSPLLRIVPAGALPAAEGGVLLTSANAVGVWTSLGGRPGLPAWVVGPRTAELARQAGFDVRDVAQDAEALAKLVPADASPLLHLRGREQRGDLAGALRARGLIASDAVIYRQEPQDLTPEAVSLLASDAVLVPLYSPRTAELLGRGCPARAKANLRLICLSRAVADAAPVRPIAVAETPDGPAMLRAILMNLHSSAVERGGGTV